MIEAFEKWKAETNEEDQFLDFFADRTLCMDNDESIAYVAWEVYKIATFTIKALNDQNKALNDSNILLEKRIELLEEKFGAK